MAKCILLVRVSTDRQSFDEQEKELFDMAIADGYVESDIIAISEKESGIKLKENERKGLNRMKEIILNDDNVDCVYAYEVSRISRKKAIIFSIVEFLVEHRVNLKIKEPHVKLLKDDGSIDDNADTTLTLYAQIAESEMRVKKARFKRTTTANSLKGKFNGGSSIKFGYTVDNNGYYVVNEEEAHIVRMIYDLYVNSDMGASLLAKELESRGILMTSGKVLKILQAKGYDGEKYVTRSHVGDKTVNGNVIQYPPIISKELWEMANAKRKTNNNNALKNENYYLARNLISCPKCGCRFIAHKGHNSYLCGKFNNRGKFGEKCDNGTYVNLDLMDSLLWYVCRTLYAFYLADLKEEDMSKYITQIEILKDKIKVAEGIIKTIPSKIEKASVLNLRGFISDETCESETSRLKNKEQEINIAITEYNKEIESINKLINNINSKDEYSYFINSDYAADAIESRKKMYEIIRMFVKNVNIEQLQGRNKLITINLLDGTNQQFHVQLKSNRWITFEILNGNEYNITDKMQSIPKVTI